MKTETTTLRIKEDQKTSIHCNFVTKLLRSNFNYFYKYLKIYSRLSKNVGYLTSDTWLLLQITFM